MPKGKHKGGKRIFTNFEDLEEQEIKAKNQKAWRKARGQDDGDDEEEGSEKSVSEEESGSSEEEESEDEAKQQKSKGIQSLIQIENPNHVVAKAKKVASASSAPPEDKTQLSRREREEIAKQKADAHYRKLHNEGKTEEARADLERLALIRKQREEASKKKDEERKAKEAALQAKKEQATKFISKKDKSKS